MRERLPWKDRRHIIEILWDIPGKLGTQVYWVRQLAEPVMADDGSNGTMVFAVAVDGSVETVYIRRAEQDNSPEFFGAEQVFDCVTG